MNSQVSIEFFFLAQAGFELAPVTQVAAITGLCHY